MRAQELIGQGKNREEIVNELKEFCPRITLLAFVDDFRYAVQGGRVKLPKIFVKPAFLLQKLGIRLLVGLEKGKVKLFRISFGKNMAKILAKEIDRQRDNKEIRVAIAHADNRGAAEELKKELEKKQKFYSFLRYRR